MSDPGWVVLRLGARPFFVLAAAWAVLAMAIWPAVLMGDLALPTAFPVVAWHAHELVFGFTGAVMAGFLLTAIPNWTGRKPVAGAALGGLVLAWIAGRLAVGCSAWLGDASIVAALIFPVALAGVAWREISASGNARNRKVVAVLGLFAGCDLWFQIAVRQGWDTAPAQRGGIAILVALVLLIGGRVVPNFTRNWLKRNAIASAIPEFGRGDVICAGLAAAGLLGWVAAPETIWLAPLFAVAGIATLWRMARWGGWAARRDWLMAVLHVGFAVAGLGFLAATAAALWPDAIPQALVVHVWTVGAIGLMTTGMMTRATLGHTGGTLRADGPTRAIYAAVGAALLARLGVVLLPSFALPLIGVAAALWCAAFALFLWRYGRALLSG